MIKNIVFDMGGVLVDFNPERMINDNFPPEYHDIIMTEVFKSSHWQDMDRGTVSVEEAVNNMLLNIPKKLHSTVRKVIFEKEEQMPPLHEMTPIIHALHSGGYRLFVLSNCADWFYEYKNSIPGIELFDGFLVSSDVHINKPDTEIFRLFLRKFSLKAEECLFIDDSPANIYGAKETGFSVYCFQDRNFDKLKNYIFKLTEV